MDAWVDLELMGRADPSSNLSHSKRTVNMVRDFAIDQKDAARGLLIPQNER